MSCTAQFLCVPFPVETEVAKPAFPLQHKRANIAQMTMLYPLNRSYNVDYIAVAESSSGNGGRVKKRAGGCHMKGAFFQRPAFLKMLHRELLHLTPRILKTIDELFAEARAYA